MSTRHTSTPKGRFVLRADAIRPYGLSGEAATFIQPLCSVTLGRILSAPIERVQIYRKKKRPWPLRPRTFCVTC